jgi:Domain of unknown function (DUF4412)
MKRLFCLLIILPLLHIQAARAQKPFSEGTIVFSMQVKTDDAQAAAMLNNSTMTIYVKGNHIRHEMNFNGGFQNTSITNLTDSSTVVLMDGMGQKKMMKLSQGQLDKIRNTPANYTIDFQNDTKTILGYSCKKTIVHVKGGTDLVFWVTDQLIPTSTEWSHVSGLKELPLEFDMTQRGAVMTLTATKVDLSPVSDDKFKIPDGYEEVTPEQMMGGGKQ